MAIASIKDYEEIVKTVQVYLDGGNVSGDAQKPAFLESATINGAPIQTLFDTVDELGPGEAVGRIDVLDVVGNIAAVRVTMENFHGADYVDFHVLIKGENGWKIASKVFTEK
ncbi:nuclear transport factor 2 family protein [Atopobiaceae bacterium 24-176]